jgi:hypothetical protein
VKRLGSSGEAPAGGGLQLWMIALVSIGALLVVAAVVAFLVARRRRRASEGSATSSSDGHLGGDGDTTMTNEFTLGMATDDIVFSTFGDVARECDSLVPDDDLAF